jgi:hypothetical protein
MLIMLAASTMLMTDWFTKLANKKYPRTWSETPCCFDFINIKSFKIAEYTDGKIAEVVYFDDERTRHLYELHDFKFFVNGVEVKDRVREAEACMEIPTRGKLVASNGEILRGFVHIMCRRGLGKPIWD